MVSNVTIGSGVVALMLLTLHIISLATPNWFIVASDGRILVRVGLFAVCPEEGDTCIPYGDIMFEKGNKSSAYFAYVGLNVIGCICNVIFLISCIAHACATHPHPERSFVTRQASIWFFAAGFLIAAVVWIFVSLVAAEEKLSSLGSLSTLSIKPGYSFYIACITGGFYFLSASFLVTYARRLPAVVTSGAVISHNPQVIVMQAGTSSISSTGDTLGQFYSPPPTYPVTGTGGYPSNYRTPQDDPSYKYDQ